jgi:hypothetical protein
LVQLRLARPTGSQHEDDVEQEDTLMANKLAVMADLPSDYLRLGLSPTTTAPWEDGKRTDDSAGT